MSLVLIVLSPVSTPSNLFAILSLQFSRTSILLCHSCLYFEWLSNFLQWNKDSYSSLALFPRSPYAIFHILCFVIGSSSCLESTITCWKTSIHSPRGPSTMVLSLTPCTLPKVKLLSFLQVPASPWMLSYISYTHLNHICYSLYISWTLRLVSKETELYQVCQRAKWWLRQTGPKRRKS